MENALEIKDLTKEYPGFRLDKISFTLPSGCILGLIGENGAGKSTTIKLILDMIHKDGGEIRILGKSNTENLQLTKEDVGVVLDEVGLPHTLNSRQIGRIMKNTFANWDSSAYGEYLKKFAIPEKKAFGDYSRGMKMKLGIAVALSHNPRLLILDEATSGLDPLVRDEILDIFNDFTRSDDHSILISSHIVSDLEKLCDYIAFLHKGKLMLFEEKDVLLGEYGIAHCSESELSKLPKSAVKHKKVTPYGAEVLVKRSGLPSSVKVSPVSIEELFVTMAHSEGGNN